MPKSLNESYSSWLFFVEPRQRGQKLANNVKNCGHGFKECYNWPQNWVGCQMPEMHSLTAAVWLRWGAQLSDLWNQVVSSLEGVWVVLTSNSCQATGH